MKYALLALLAVAVFDLWIFKFPARFDAWVERTDWRRIDRIVHRAMIFGVVAVAFLFLSTVVSAVEKVVR